MKVSPTGPTAGSRCASTVGTWLVRVVFVVFALIVVFPLLWNVLTSLKTNAQIMDDPWGLPTQIDLSNYSRAFRDAHMGEYVLNSVIVTATSLVLLLFLTLTSSYGLVRFRSGVSRFVRSVYMAGLFIQPTILLVPIFLLLSRVGLVDSRAGLVLVYAAGALPFSVFLLTGYLSSVPLEFEDAAMIDGCGRLATLFLIIAPLATPGLLTVAIFNFFNFWNEYPLALTLIQSERRRTLTIGLANLYEIQRYATDWGALFAGLAIVLLPTVVIYIFTQRELTRGITAGGLKG